ncbi:hypothetical protein ACQP2U_43260 (plasmid) [Nocardia sp. CA-084685]|uniref:hypothetical protein n=1 Tax=Nocardia sp. CA-084685 TaxID=3239970 RepID=UPI003D97470F
MMIHRRIRVSAIVVIATALAVAVVTGCGHHESTPLVPSTSSSAPAAPPLRVDDRDPDAVLVAAAAQIYSWQPAQDPSAAAGFTRARALLDPTYIESVGATAAGLSQVTGATWDRWAAQHATVTATAHIGHDDHPADTATAHQRVVVITQHITLPNPAASEPDRVVVAYMIASRLGSTDRWRISMIAPKEGQP